MWHLILISLLISGGETKVSPKVKHYLRLYEKTHRKERLLKSIQKELSHKKDPELEKVYKILLEKEKKRRNKK